MAKEYADHWANLEDMHLLSRLRIGQMLCNFFEAHGYVKDGKYSKKDPFHMSDDEFLKTFRAFMNGKEASPQAVKPAEPPKKNVKPKK